MYYKSPVTQPVFSEPGSHQQGPRGGGRGGGPGDEQKPVAHGTCYTTQWRPHVIPGDVIVLMGEGRFSSDLVITYLCRFRDPRGPKMKRAAEGMVKRARELLFFLWRAAVGQRQNAM